MKSVVGIFDVVVLLLGSGVGFVVISDEGSDEGVVTSGGLRTIRSIRTNSPSCWGSNSIVYVKQIYMFPYFLMAHS